MSGSFRRCPLCGVLARVWQGKLLAHFPIHGSRPCAGTVPVARPGAFR